MKWKRLTPHCAPNFGLASPVASRLLGILLGLLSFSTAFAQDGEIKFKVTEPSEITILVEPLGSDPEGSGEPPKPPTADLFWNGEPPKNRIKNPQHTSITPDGYDGPGMLGDWIDEENPRARTNPVIQDNRGNASEDPSTIDTRLQFWYKTSGLDHVNIESRSWDVKGFYVIRIDNPPDKWTLFDVPFDAMTKTGSITSTDHIVFDLDTNGPGNIWVDEVYIVEDDTPPDPGPGPDPDPDLLSSRVTDTLSVVYSHDEIDLPGAVSHGAISLGEDGEGGWKIGHAYLTSAVTEGPSIAIKTGPNYLSHAEKLAFFGLELGGIAVGFSGDTIKGVLHGPVTRPVEFLAQTDTANPWSGERVYVCDFSDVATEGVYHFELAGVGNSRKFSIADSGYDVIAGHVLRAYAYQTQGVKLSLPRVKSTVQGVLLGDELPPARDFDKAWVDGYNVYDAAAYRIWKAVEELGTVTYEQFAKMTNAQRAQVTKDIDFAVLGADFRTMTDAADMDCKYEHVGVPISLCTAYLIRPELKDVDLGVPNPGPYPDILWLALLELEPWAKLQDAIGTGGVPSIIGQYNRHRDLPDLVAVSGAPDKHGSFTAAIAFDLMAEATGDRKWHDRAVSAYEWASQNGLEPKSIGHISNRGRGDIYYWSLSQEACDAINASTGLWEAGARARLWKSTGEAKYLAGMPNVPQFLAEDPFKDASLWVYWELVGVPGFDWVLDTFKKRADRFVAWRMDSSNPYRRSMKPGTRQMAFGKSLGYLPAQELLLVNSVAPNQKYVDAAVGNINHVLGMNAFGKSMTSGVGYSPWTNYQDMKPFVFGTTLYGEASPNYGSRAPINEGLREDPPTHKSRTQHESALPASNEFTVQETFVAAATALTLVTSFSTPRLGEILNAGVMPIDEGWYVP